MALLSPFQPRAGRGPPRQGRLGGPCPQWGRHNHRARRSRSCKLTQKTCLKEPAAVPRCPVGQPTRLLGPEGLSIFLPQPHPPTVPGGRQAGPPSPVELLTYSARWLCTVCPGPNPEPQVGTGGHHLGTPPLSAAAPGPLPQQPHRSPLLGISAIKAVGVASSPELGPPLPRSPQGGHCPAWLEGGRPGRGGRLQLPKSSRLGWAWEPRGACCRQWGPEVPVPVSAQAGGSAPSDPRPQRPRPPASGL